jgi:DNA polymerase I-like protein with 3'-5' exonuclease and polymerase domains
MRTEITGRKQWPLQTSNIVYDPDHLTRVIEEVGNRAMDLDEPTFVFDLETRPGPTVWDSVNWHDKDDVKFHATNPRTNEMYWLSIATRGVAWAIPMGHPNGEQIGTQAAPLRPGTKSTKRVVPVYGPPPEQMMPGDVVDIIRPLFMDHVIRKANHNVKFDLLTIAKYLGCLPAPPYGDTMVAKSLLAEDPPHDLGACVKQAFGFKYAKIGKNLLEHPFSAAGTYSFLDAKYTWLLWPEYLKRLSDEGLLDYFWFECDVTEVLAHMEYAGAPVRGDEVVDLDFVLNEGMEEIKGEIWSAAGRQFELTNPGEKAKFIFGDRGHKPYKYTPKKGDISTAEDHLRSFEGDPLVKRLMQFDDLKKLHSTYVLNYKKFEHEGRIHTSYKQHGTRTGRFSSGEPNLQNVPKPDTPVGKQIRGLFWGGSDDMCLVVGDYSQIELRVLAYYSGDPTMCKAFADGEDIHQASANTLGTDRSIAKNINFAIPFGAGAKKVFAMGGGAFSLKDAEKFYALHKERFPRVWAFIYKTRSDCRKNKPHVVHTILGRKRRLPRIVLVRHTNEDLKAQGAMAERQAVNTVIQGSAADLIKKAMVRLHDMLDDDMQLILQVHDELVVTCPRDKADRCIELMREAMEGEEMQILRNRDGSIRVPVTANIKAVDRWAEAK